MYIAGILSGLLHDRLQRWKIVDVGSGHDSRLLCPTTTSNFMIGGTAAAAAEGGIYLARGYIDPGLAMPVAGTPVNYRTFTGEAANLRYPAQPRC